MANLVITSTATSILVVFNNEADKVNIKQASFKREEISEVLEHTGTNYVTIVMSDGNEFDLSFNSVTGALIVDSIDGNPINDNDDLFAKLIVLQQV